MRLTYVGHSTLLIELDGVRLLTDPLLRGRFLHVERRVPAVDMSRVTDVDAVLISHAHHDHLDRPSIRKVSRQARIVVPRGARRFLPPLSLRRAEEISRGDRVSVGPVRIEATRADHRRGRILHRGPPAVGYRITGSQTAYFAGDTDLFPEMRAFAPGLDVALLPVWGWGTQIGSGHLDPARAAEALTLLEPRVAIPIHWGTYYPIALRRFRAHLLSEPPLAFAREAARRAPQVDVRVLQPGESTVVTD